MLADQVRKVQADYENYLSRTPLRQVAEPLWIERPVLGLPDLLVLRLPPELSGNRVEHDEVGRRHKVLFSETAGDRAYLENCLDRPLPIDGIVVSFRDSIDRTNMRPSTIAHRGRSMALYPATAPGWPHLVVWSAGGRHGIPDLFRGAYYWMAFDDPGEAGDAWTRWWQ